MSTPQWIQPFKEPYTIIKCIKGYHYKYAVSYKYDPKTKKTKRKPGKILGKITEHGGFTPSPKSLLRDATAPSVRTVDTKMYGAFAIFQTLIAEEIPSLIEIFGQEHAEALLVFAMMRFVHRTPIKRVEHYHALDFCSTQWHICCVDC
jgi:hypothetical protein